MVRVPTDPEIDDVAQLVIVVLQHHAQLLEALVLGGLRPGRRGIEVGRLSPLVVKEVPPSASIRDNR